MNYLGTDPMISKKHGPTLCLESWSQALIIGKMGGWMDEWMNGLTGGWMSGRTDRIKGDKKCNESFALDKPRTVGDGPIRLSHESALGGVYAERYN